MSKTHMGYLVERTGKILFAVSLIGAFAVACVAGSHISAPSNRHIEAQLNQAMREYRGDVAPPKDGDGLTARRFVEVYERVQKSFVLETREELLLDTAFASMKQAYPDPGVATDSDLIEAAIQGMLASLDDYSVYMDAEAYSRLNQAIDGRFGGLGIEIKKDPIGLSIISPIDGTPAERAGLLPGDRLSHADGAPLSDLTLQESVQLLRGEPGTEITVTVHRQDLAPFDMPLTREIIRIIGVKARMEGNIGYLRLTHFVRGLGDDLRQKMKELKRDAGPRGLKGFVLDLRNNPGGLLDESIHVAGAFLKGGLVVSTRTRSQDRYRNFNADLSDPSEGLPVVVMINQGSASASEIVAGAIKYRNRGRVIGEKSYGKGSVQTTFVFQGGAGMKLTTARYYTPGGKTVEEGIEPGVIALDNPDTREKDEALETALEILHKTIEGYAVPWNNGTLKN